MKNKNDVFLLFKFSQEHSADEGTSSPEGRYQVIFFFDSNGEIDFSEFKKANTSFDQDYENLVFKTKEQLTEFSKSFIEGNQYQSIFLLSANDFNIGIESCHDLVAFREIFKRYGTCVESSKPQSKSIFSKIF